MTDSTISSASSISSAGKPPNRMSRDGLPRSCPKSVFRPLDSDESLSATSRRYEDPSDYADDDTQMDSGPPTRTGSQVSTASSTSDYANTDDELSSVLREESIRAPRFADLYIAEQREREQQQPDTRPPYDAAYHSRSEDDVERSAARRRDRSKTVTAREAPSMHANASKRQSLGPRSPPIDGMVAGRNEGPSPFALRVKEKLQAAALADGLLLQRDRVSSMSSFGCISASASNLGTESGSVQRTDAETDSEEDALARAWSPRSEEALQRQTVVQLSDSSSSSVMRRAARDPRRSVLEDHPEMDEDDHTPVQPSGSQFRTLPRTPSMQGGLSALASLHDVPEHGPPRISYTTSVPAHGPSSSASANSTVAARTRSVCSGAREMGRPSRTGGSEQVSSVRNKILQLEIRVQEADDFERGE
ncbi:hypothetical protein PLICRDRAFT_49247 [Plicaturopsis crispa FD-325 SS-3]|nr:hypothetical protein PLICRDRAFT_49247 [Plicaturopsis crispa FD-325 SS-3]